MVGSNIEQPIREHNGFSPQLIVTLFLFLFAVGFAERTIYYVNPVQGLLIHAGILVVLILYVAARWNQVSIKYLLGLSIVPIMRIISLTLPSENFPLSFWYILVSLILCVVVLLLAERLEITRLDMRINLKAVPLQLLIGLAGILIGVVHHYIYRPSFSINVMPFIAQMGLGLILLVCNGFVEELIFRGMLQHLFEKILDPRLAWLFVASMYSLLNLGSFSISSVALTFLISIIFSWIVARTGSILGVSLAHGLASIMMFLVLPGLSL